MPGDDLTYTWMRNGNNVVDQKESSLMIEQMNNATSDQFQCTARSTTDPRIDRKL